MLLLMLMFGRGGRDRPDRGRDRDRVSMSREDGEMSDRRGSRFPDSHQLFVGNLPHNVSDKELKNFFEGKTRHIPYSLLTLLEAVKREKNVGPWLNSKFHFKFLMKLLVVVYNFRKLW